jgi:hypothetical protein
MSVEIKELDEPMWIAGQLMVQADRAETVVQALVAERPATRKAIGAGQRLLLDIARAR